MEGRRCWRTSLPQGYKKSKPEGLPMRDFITYCNIWLKCYITFCDIVADGKRGSNVLANAINNFEKYLFLIKKNIKNYNFNFSTVIVVPSGLTSTIHLTLSPAVISKNSTTSFGIPQRNEFFWRFA